MGNITLQRLPEFFDKWNVPYSLESGWESRGRSSGGFDSFKGVVVHHTATPSTALLVNTVHYAITADIRPIANAVISRTKDGPRVVLWAGLASNHAGVGGPILTSRGVVAKDNANRTMFGFEAENDGVGEYWDDEMCDLYIRAVVAVLDWGNNCTPGVSLNAGDVIAHREWTVRKIDPAGPSRFNGYDSRAKWNMDQFRGEVFMLMMTGPNPQPELPPDQPPVPSIGAIIVEFTSRNLTEGANGTDVKFYQRRLNDIANQGLVLDGSYGPQTTKAIRNWQSFFGLTVDGQLGPITQRSIIEISLQT